MVYEIVTQDPPKVKSENVEVVKLNADPVSLNENYIKSYVIIGKEGRVLVDPGPANAHENIIDSLKAIGLMPKELDAIFLTHIHLDHAGGASKLAEECNCKVYVHPKGLPHLKDPSKLNEAAKRTLGKEIFEIYGPMEPINENKLVQTEDNNTYTFKDVSVKVVFTPGHAPHHQAILANTVLFPGDALGEVTTWQGAYTPTTPHRVIVPMLIDSAMKLASLRVTAAGYTHRGFVVGKEAFVTEAMGSVEQIRTWIQVITVRQKECKDDVWCYYEKLLNADPLLDKLHRTGEIEKSKLLKNSIRMSIDGIYKYVTGIK